MAALQQINHNGRLAAIVIGGQAIIDATLTDNQQRQVQAMCLYALEIQAGARAGPYTDASAAQYAHHAATSREGDSPSF